MNYISPQTDKGTISKENDRPGEQPNQEPEKKGGESTIELMTEKEIEYSHIAGILSQSQLTGHNAFSTGSAPNGQLVGMATHRFVLSHPLTIA